MPDVGNTGDAPNPLGSHPGQKEIIISYIYMHISQAKRDKFWGDPLVFVKCFIYRQFETTRMPMIKLTLHSAGAREI